MTDHHSLLMNALNFTPDDLAANRRGRYTLRQRDQLIQALGSILPITALFFLLGLLFFAADTSLEFYQHIMSSQSVGLTLVGFALFIAIRYWFPLILDLLSGEVTTVTGLAQPSYGLYRGRLNVEYYLKIDIKTFHIQWETYQVIDSHRYSVYYTPCSMRILSAERLEEPGGQTLVVEPATADARSEPVQGPDEKHIFIRFDHPQDAEAYAIRAYQNYSLHQYDKAILDFTEAIRLNPQFAGAYRSRGMVFNELQQYDQAIVDYTEAIRLDPQDAEAYANRAAVYSGPRQYDQAITDFTEAIRLNPRRALVYNHRGLAYFYSLQQDELALADYTEAIRLDPQDAEAYANRAAVYYGLRQYNQAITDCTEAIRLNPRLADARYTRGAAYYYGLLQGELALADYSEAIRLRPQFADAYYHRGVAYYGFRQYLPAIADFTNSIRLSPQLTSTYLPRGLSHSHLGHTETAAQDFMQWITLSQVRLTTLDAVPNGKPIIVEIHEGSVYQISFDAHAGDRFSATASGDNTSPVDTLLVFLGPDGAPRIADNNGGTNGGSAIKDYVLPENGRYTLVVSHAGGPSDGTITVNIVLTPPDQAVPTEDVVPGKTQPPESQVSS